MEVLRRFEPVFLFLMMLGALNWLIVALFDTNVVTEIVGGGTAADVVYVIVGLAALAFIPRLVDGLSHMGGDHRVRPHGA